MQLIAVTQSCTIFKEAQYGDNSEISEPSKLDYFGKIEWAEEKNLFCTIRKFLNRHHTVFKSLTHKKIEKILSLYFA